METVDVVFTAFLGAARQTGIDLSRRRRTTRRRGHTTTVPIADHRVSNQ